MNRFWFCTTVLVLAVSMPPAVYAQAVGDMKGMKMPATPPASAATKTPTTAHATGVVKKVDVGAGVVTIAHDAIPAINWPPMTMGFRVHDKEVISKLVVGQKVEFDFVLAAKGYVVTSIK